MMKLIQATFKDLPQIMNIIKQVQTLLRNNGIDQWQNGYPNAKIIQNDILQNKSFIVVANNVICATVMISLDPEPTYRIIEGKWQTHQSYVVVHRMAVEKSYHGKKIAEYIFKEVESICLSHKISSIRVDTHPDNRTMQHILAKINFVYCGIIKVHDGTFRWAYEKRI